MFSRRVQGRAARRRYVSLATERLEDRSLLAQVGYQVHLLPPDGNLGGVELTSVNVGQSYDLVVSVRDVRDNPGPNAGVYAGYLDIGYDSSKTRVQVAEVQRLRIGPFTGGNSATSASGTFALTFDGQTTSPIPYSGDVTTLAAATQTALASLNGIGPGNVSVSADILHQSTQEVILQVRFVNQLYNENVANLTVDSHSLTGPTNPQVSVTYEGDLAMGAAYAFKESFRSRVGTPRYLNGLSAGNLPNLLDDVGAFATGFTPPGTGPMELVRARLIATTPGGVTFTGSVATRNLPAHDTLFFDPVDPVAVSEIDVGTPKTLTIIGDQPYVAFADSASLLEDSPGVVIDVLANDTLPTPSTTKHIVSFTQPASGTVTQDGNSLRYVPAANFFGTVTFTYVAKGNAMTDSAFFGNGTVTVVVAPVNDAPTIDPFPGPIVLLEDAPLQTITLTGINAGGGENQLLTGTATQDGGLLELGLLEFFPETSSAKLSFRPQANVSGAGAIVISISDGGGTADGGVDQQRLTIAVVVNPVNDAPSFNPGPDQVANDQSGPQAVVGWAKDISAGPNEAEQTLTFSIVAADPSLFSAPPQLDAGGTLTYTPALNAAGTTLVTVQLADSGGTESGGVNQSSPLTFSITIDKLNLLHNAALPLDANDDNAITASDAVGCINFLNAFSARAVTDLPSPTDDYLDVNADGYITAADPLAVINYINSFGPAEVEQTGGEGESAADMSELLALLATDAVEAGARKRR